MDIQKRWILTFAMLVEMTRDRTNSYEGMPVPPMMEDTQSMPSEDDRSPLSDLPEMADGTEGAVESTNSNDLAQEIFQVMPREQVGAVTGTKYEFQYHQAALDGLQVLDDRKAICLYCEWHDDYAVETAEEGHYRFHQVKTRSRSDGPWKLNTFFGIRSKLSKQMTAGEGKIVIESEGSSIFLKMFDLVEKFKNRCEAFVFVTDAGIARDFQMMQTNVHRASDLDVLDESSLQQLTKIHASIATKRPDITREMLFEFISKLEFKDAVGSEKDMDLARDALARKIYDLSEVDLRVSESQIIAADLVSMVRTKSHRVLGVIPMNLEELRKAKGIQIHDILQLLSLSTEGYRELKAGGKESVVTLSRLQRYCKSNGFPDDFVRRCCECKTLWDEWNLKQKYMTDSLDLDALREECRTLLRFHQTDGFDIHKLFDEVKKITKKYENRIISTEPLNSLHVMGLVLTLAIGAGS